MEYYQPKVLLGLTATPERMDGKSVLDYFGGRIAAEIRLPEAIDRKLLCPFQYFGVTDTADLSSLKWRTGGYDKNELSNLYTLSGMVAERRADLVVNSILKYVTDINEVKGLGFCVSIAHAQFMARYFNTHGIPSMALTGDSLDEERNAAKQRLGRGLRLAENKDCLTILDFIGQANKKYNFEEKFAALLSNTTRSVSRELKEGFVSAPKGCYIQLEKIAAKYVLDNITAPPMTAPPGLWRGRLPLPRIPVCPRHWGTSSTTTISTPGLSTAKRSASAGCASAPGRHPILQNLWKRP